jgi:phosphopantothenoylcysteine decarboxylase / phosphopantothenate---cysteine ligase
MSQSKIVICITGSIAAYKSCELISTLKKSGNEVKVIMSLSAEKFIGQATLQALSGHPVAIDDFSSASLMNHIELGKWCDLAIVYPATAQTINSFAAGTGHELHQSFFLAYDFKKPFLIAPAMNSRMLSHPVTQKSTAFLKEMGCLFLPTEDGNLACGEIGEGRLLEPIKTIPYIVSSLGIENKKVKRILITAGGTRETIDGVRTLTNMSTGQTGAEIADALYEKGYQVLLLTNQFAIKPKTNVKVDTYDSFREIFSTLKALGQSHSFDLILHAAAISDYSIDKIQTPEGSFLPGESKMSSEFDNISIQLKRNEKILPRLKVLFKNEPTIVGFKLTSTESKQEQAKAIFNLFSDDAVDFVVHNDMKDIKKGQRRYLMTSKEGQQVELESTKELAEQVTKILNNTYKENNHDLMS